MAAGGELLSLVTGDLPVLDVLGSQGFRVLEFRGSRFRGLGFRGNLSGCGVEGPVLED